MLFKVTRRRRPDIRKRCSSSVDESTSHVLAESSVEKAQLPRTPSFSVNRPGEDTGIVFAGLPLGHEFTSSCWPCCR